LARQYHPKEIIKFKMAIPLAVIGLVWASVAYIIFLFVQSFFKARHNAARARELKCELPPLQKNRLPLGIDQVQRSLKADKELLFPDDTIRRFEEMNANTFRYQIMGSHSLFTCDEKNIQAMLATQFPDFDIGPVRRGNMFRLFGNGIFTQDGKAWEHSRAMMRPQFAREQVSDLDLEERHLQNLVKALPTNADGWTDQVDLQVLFFRLTLDSATEFLFGESVDSQLIALSPSDSSHNSTSISDEKSFATAFDLGQAIIATRVRLADRYWLYNPRSYVNCSTICHDFIDHFVRLALSKDLREKELEKGGAKEKYVFLEALAAETRDPIELRSQLLHILLAGRDTTASLLGWLFFCLARDPVRFNKLREVILAEFGTYDAPSEITFARLKSCQYLQFCNNETLRLYTVVPLNSRTANKDTTLPRGGGVDGKSKVFVPAGTQVDYSVHVMHHRRDIWGDDVKEFKPERWEGRKAGWEFLPVRSLFSHPL
jgi:cytochrome P450